MGSNPVVRALATVAFCAPLAMAQSKADRALEEFFQNRMDSAVVLFAGAAQESPRNATVRAWLAEAALRAGKTDEAQRAVDDALRLDPCSAQAYAVRAAVFMPRFAPAGQANDDSTWTYLTKAVGCDPSDGNAWTDIWKYAIMRRDTAMESRALRVLVSTGFLTNPHLSHAEWLLRSLPQNAVLLTGGDMDTFAPLAVQVARGVRTDVAVINAVMLSATWYSRPVLGRHHIAYDARAVVDSAVRGPQRIISWLREQAVGASGRPLTFALTAPVDTASRLGVLQLAGPYWIAAPAGAARTDSAGIASSMRVAESYDWRGLAASESDRSPDRRHGPHPAMLATRMLLVENALSTWSDERFLEREQWLRQFFTRASIDSLATARMLQYLRSQRP